jgi:glutathione S-transferase
MDSSHIAQLLETQYPSPKMHLESPYIERVRDAIFKTFRSLSPELLKEIASILNPRSAEYFERTRSKKFQVSSLEAFSKEKGGEAMWEAAKEPLEEIRGLLHEKEGPFFDEQMTYADFHFVTFLKCLSIVNQGIYKRVIEFDESFGRIWGEYEKYFGRDDH